MRTLLAAGLVFAGGLLAAGASPAAEPRVQLGCGPSALRFDYAEYADHGAKLDRESALLPGFFCGIGVGTGRWNLSVDASYHSGKVDYEGRTQAGTAVSSATDTRVAEAGIRALLFVDDARRFGVGIGLSHRWWQRDIRGVGQVAGLDERYATWIASIDTHYEALRDDWGSIGVDLSLTLALGPQMTVGFEGRFDERRLQPRGRLGLRLAVPVAVDVNRSARLLVEPGLEYWGFDRSDTETLLRDGQPVGTVFQPDGRGYNFGLRIVWIQAF